MDILLPALFLPLLLLNPSPSVADESNILVSGGVLHTDGQLSYDGNIFVIQDDCNLVLHNRGSGFQSNTHGFGTKCTLTLSDHGELIIKNNNDSTVWSSPGGPVMGRYVAVLRPDGQVSVFGPAVWSTPPLFRSTSPVESKEVTEQANTSSVRNVMFTSQILNRGSELASGDYTLALTDDCNLEFNKLSAGLKVWESKTKRNELTDDCFLMFDRIGTLKLWENIGNYASLLWGTPGGPEQGDYVLVVMHNHGQAVVYGPTVWSTAS